MLKLFEVTGFKNFKNTFRLNFSDVRNYTFNSTCIKSGLLKNIIIYGKNSVGKTNFGLALFDIVGHLTSNNVTPGLYENYINISNLGGVAQFHYVFQFDENIIDYNYSKYDNKELTYECLKMNDKIIIEKDYLSGKVNLNGIKELAPTLNYSFTNDESLLKYALNNTSFGDNHPLYKMMHFVSKMLWFRSLDENRYIGYKTKSTDFYSFLIKDYTMLKEFQDLLAEAGVGHGVCIKKDIDGNERLYSTLPYENTGSIPFFQTASSGTKALYTFFYWYKTAPEISLLFIDEFDAYYHFELSETLVKLLESQNNPQIMLTSHNTNLLTNRIMRPDCYFILTAEKISSFADATSRELLEGHNLEKLYLSGEFNV